MGNLRDQMEVLAQGIATSARERKMAVGDSQAQTASMLSTFGREHAAMARALKSGLAESTKGMVTNVALLRADFAKAHGHMTKVQGAGLAKDRRDRSREVAELMNDFHVSRGEMAQELTESLQKFAQRVQFQVSSLREGFRNSRREVREDVQAAHQVWNFLLLGQAGVAAQTAIPASLRHHRPAGGFEMGEAEEKVTVGEAVRRFIGKPGKPKKK